MEGGARGLEGRGGKCPPQADAATPTPLPAVRQRPDPVPQTPDMRRERM